MSLTTAGEDAPTSSAHHEPQRHDDATNMNGASISTEDDEHKSIPEPPSRAEPPYATTSNDDESSIATKALHFAATASPGVLGGIAVGVSAVLYVLLGRVALLFIGAVTGVLAFISWEARNPEVARAVRGEKGLDILERLRLEARNIDTKPDEKDEEDDEQYTLKAFDEFRPETRDALSGLIDAIVRDYVKWWYNPIIPSDHSFPLACRKTLNSYFLAISNHLHRKRPADAFLDFLTNSSSMVIVFMSELASAFADLPVDSDMSAVDALSQYRANRPDCNLNNLLNRQQQSSKFRMVSEDLLGFLDSNSRECDAARVFLREILANSVLENALQTCSQADWLNGWIVYLLEAGEPDLNQAIDVGMQTGRDAVPQATNAAPSTFADMDGNMGNVSIAKPARSSMEAKSKGGVHKKKLSKADEEMEVAMEEMKKLNAMIAEDEKRRERASTIRHSSEVLGSAPRMEQPRPTVSPSEHSPTSATLSGNVKSHTPATSTDGISTKSEAVPTPVTPRSMGDNASQGSSPRKSGGSGSSQAQFTSFDQVQAPVEDIVTEEEEKKAAKRAPLTLHNATFTLHDDTSGDKSRIRNKPSWDYLIQVEPSSAGWPGWMIVRRYSDFETLHEILRRIAAVSGATAFVELHKELPQWKIHTRESLRGELERYLRDACWYASLAESEGMKRFLEKSQGHTHGDSKALNWDTFGKNMLDVLNTAPKGVMGVMEGGKSLVGGVQGVFGNFPGLSRKSTSQSMDLQSPSSNNRLSISTPPRMDTKSPARSDRGSIDSQRSSVVATQPGKVAPMERRPSYQSQQGDADSDYFRMGRSDRMDSVSGLSSARPSREHSRASSLAPLRSPSSVSLGDLKLPPQPDDMPDDYEFPANGEQAQQPSHAHARSESLTIQPDNRQGPSSPNAATSPVPSLNGKKGVSKPARQYSQLSEPEVRVAVELLFAIINEMYTLSSAWNIRRTLLTAAKSFLLRPGNPSLLTVQNLIQTSVLDSNTSDAGIATQLRKLRENTMPTNAERATWPAEMTAEEKEKLRLKARGLLIRSGVPAALMGVMGQAATSEALGRVFDCLQIEEVARGLIFGILLQLVRVITH